MSYFAGEGPLETRVSLLAFPELSMSPVPARVFYEEPNPTNLELTVIQTSPP